MDDRLMSYWLLGLSRLATLEGMKALNKERELRGESLAYGEDAFDQIAQELSEMSGAVCN